MRRLEASMHRLHRIAHRAVALLLLLVGAFAARQAVTHACTLDGQPTAVANGQRAAPSRGAISAATVRTWAPFSFPGSYRVNTGIRLREDQAQLRAVLPPEAWERAWLWQFGDGTHTLGRSVVHRYRRPGRYRITVAAYYPTWRSYVAFDAVRIVLTR